MIIRNGKVGAGWRLDELSADGPSGMEMLANPFAIVPKEENAERIVVAVNSHEAMLEALEMIRDADDDCAKDGLSRIPHLARAKIDRAIAKGRATGQ